MTPRDHDFEFDCDAVQMALSRRLDGEPRNRDEDRIAGHLATCESCRDSEDRLANLDAELRELFEPDRLAAASTAFAVSTDLGRETTRRPTLWKSVGAAAAGFLLATLLFRPWTTTPETPETATAPAEPFEQASVRVNQAGLSARSRDEIRRVRELLMRIPVEGKAAEDEVRGQMALSCAPLIEICRDEPDPARAEAARIFADLAGPADMGVLVSLLEDPDPRVRTHAARGCARLSGRDFITPFLGSTSWVDGSADDVDISRSACSASGQDWSQWAEKNFGACEIPPKTEKTGPKGNEAGPIPPRN